MATPLPGVYLAGVIASGNDANRLFIENARGHGELIVRDMLEKKRTRSRLQPGPSPEPLWAAPILTAVRLFANQPATEKPTGSIS